MGLSVNHGGLPAAVGSDRHAVMRDNEPKDDERGPAFTWCVTTASCPPTPRADPRRREVVPEPPPPDSGAAPPSAPQLPLFCIPTGSDESGAERPPSRKPWAWLLRHVFAADLQHCPYCSGPLRWLEVATTSDAIARLLERHGDADGIIVPPKTRAPRAPPPVQLSLDFHPLSLDFHPSA